jgi:hypothetical protein
MSEMPIAELPIAKMPIATRSRGHAKTWGEPGHWKIWTLVALVFAWNPTWSEEAASTPPAKSAKPMQWDMAFHPVIWESNYKLGLGLSAGLRHPFSEAYEWGGEGIYTHFRKRIDGYEPVTEIGARLFAMRSITLNAPFLLKLGATVGAHRLELENWYASVGGVAEASFSFVSPWGLYLQFSPGFLIGENSQGIFRLGIGTTYNFGGVNGRAPKEKLRPPEPESKGSSKSSIDFGGTMVPLPEPEPSSADEDLLNSSGAEKP